LKTFYYGLQEGVSSRLMGLSFRGNELELVQSGYQFVIGLKSPEKLGEFLPCLSWQA
jgi:hypothetical protein